MIMTNWHQHSQYSVECHGHGHTLDTLIAENMALGFTDFGVTDHIHTRCNLPDISASSREFWDKIRDARVHFGVEASVVSQWEIGQIKAGMVKCPEYGIREGGPPNAPLALALSSQDLVELHIEYVVGGVHWPMYVPIQREAIIKDYFRQHMFLATHPLVNIIAHPWWWAGHWRNTDGMYRGDPWLDDFGKIPRSMHDEFAAAVRQNRKVVEINGLAMVENPYYPEKFKQQYAELLADWKTGGIRLSFGSDDHGPPWERINPEIMANVDRRLQTVGITDKDFWRLPPRRTDRGLPAFRR